MSADFPYPALHATHGGIWIAWPDGHVSSVGRGEAIARASETPMILLNAPVVGARLGYGELSGLDLLELFAFVRPAEFAVPTAAGMAKAVGLDPATDDANATRLLRDIALKLLDDIDASDWPTREGAWTSLQGLARLRWPWAPLLEPRVKTPEKAERWLFSRLPEWEELPPRPQPKTISLDEVTVVERLQEIVGREGESREGQREYAAKASHIFAPRQAEGQPNMLLAEAGTGIGKTLGYLVPASQWAEQANGAVWISTYTKALQRQLDVETTRLYSQQHSRRDKVVVRKGRENYLCLLNLEDALQGGFTGRPAIMAQLVARWAAYSRDGDMVGGDLPGWLPTLFKRNGSTALTDRRGECVYAGCPHYRKCFIERSIKSAAQADIVIANHALVMLLAARGRESDGGLSHMVFDEGHHLFDAADSTFSAALTGQEAIELRRWVIGPEGKSRGRRRGLAARLMDVASYDEQGEEAIAEICGAATRLPSDGWLARINEDDPWGPIEALLAAVRQTVYARANSQEAGFGLETEAAEIDPGLISAIGPALEALEDLHRPLMKLRQRLEAIVEDAPDWLDSQARARVDGAINALILRLQTITGWIALLGRLGGPLDPDFVDWLAVDRVDGREYDSGLHRHWLDPTRPLADAVFRNAHGVLVTSATLGSASSPERAETRTGTVHLDRRPQFLIEPSPFDYANQSEVMIVTDIKRGDIGALAGAYARLITAAGGGTLGLFSAIQRLKGVHARIADRLARDGLPLYAQHVDPIDTGTLIDIFRDDPHASLFGTDALRDGVDVPGQSLRLVVMEGVPWPRPTVLHAARKAANGGSAYDDMIVRARLAQGFGRLIRRATDKGSFVILSSALPSRLLDAFPPAVPIIRLPLEDAIARILQNNTDNMVQRLSSDASLGHQDTQEDMFRTP